MQNLKLLTKLKKKKEEKYVSVGLKIKCVAYTDFDIFLMSQWMDLSSNNKIIPAFEKFLSWHI